MKWKFFLTVILLILPLVLSSPQNEVTVKAPAVRKTYEGYEGVISYITVYVEKGTGHVFIDTWPLTQIDMQSAARFAVNVACEVLGENPKKYDFFITIRSDTPIIGGPSAGATITVAVIGAIKGWKLNQDVIMTGTINPDGSIGPVGGIFEKIEVAKNYSKIFLIPEGQRIVVRQKEKNVQIGPFLMVTSEPERIDVVEYGKKIGYEVKEVYDIYDAVKYFYGKEIKVEESNERIETGFMKDYSRKEIEKVEELLQIVENEMESYKGSYKRDLNYIFQEAKKDLKNAKNDFDDGKFYTSISESFTAKIKLKYCENLLNYFSENYNIEQEKKRISEKIDSYKKEIEETEVRGFTSFQCIAAAQKRIEEAFESLENGEDDFEKIYYLTYAEERAETAMFWLEIGKKYQKDDEISKDLSKIASFDMIESAELSLVYSSTFVENDLTQKAAQLLEKAKREYEKSEYAASLFDAIQARVISNVAIEIYGSENILDERLEKAKERANSAIGVSRKNGIEPVLALSYYEYAQSQDKVQALIYYKYSREIALVFKYLVPTETETPKTAPTKPEEREFLPNLEFLIALIFLVIGIILGRFSKNI